MGVGCNAVFFLLNKLGEEENKCTEKKKSAVSKVHLALSQRSHSNTTNSNEGIC